MNLWLLRPVKDWEPWYDKVLGFVVRAESEHDARALAEQGAGDESGYGNDPPKAWMDASLTTCTILESSGEPGIILRDFASA